MNPIQPTLADLLAKRLLDPETQPLDDGEVQLHDASYGFRVEAGTAFRDANFGSKPLKSQPPEWAGFISARQAVAVPMAPGVFPQQLANWQPLMETKDLSVLRQAEVVGAPLSGLRSWVQKQASASEFAHNVALQLGESVEAIDAVGHWLTGDWDQAEKLWQNQPESVERNFNFGMALMFRNATTEALPYLKKAASELPDSSGWAHLCQLYLAVASAR